MVKGFLNQSNFDMIEEIAKRDNRSIPNIVETMLLNALGELEYDFKRAINPEEYLTPQQKINRARMLMLEAKGELKRDARKEISSQLCTCGHRRDEHTPTYSINFTEGFCEKCKCENFIYYLNR